MSSSNVVKHFHTQLKANIIRDYGGLERPSPECLDGLRSGACGAYTCKRIQAWFSPFSQQRFFYCVLCSGHCAVTQSCGQVAKFQGIVRGAFSYTYRFVVVCCEQDIETCRALFLLCDHQHSWHNTRTLKHAQAHAHTQGVDIINSYTNDFSVFYVLPCCAQYCGNWIRNKHTQTRI